LAHLPYTNKIHLSGALNKLEVVHIMSNYDDPTIWLESTRDTNAFTVHITPRETLKRWDTGPPTADTDAFDQSWDTRQLPADIDATHDKSWDTRQPPADSDAAQDAGNNTHTHPPGDGRHTHSTPTHHTHIHAERPENGRGARTPTNTHLPPNPDHPSFPDTPHQGASECSPCSIGALDLSRNNTQIYRYAAGRDAHIDSGS
jgi:hypothetical protein